MILTVGQLIDELKYASNNDMDKQVRIFAKYDAQIGDDEWEERNERMSKLFVHSTHPKIVELTVIE